MARLGEHARAIHDEQAAANLDELSAERARPLRVAVVGEFNAGKSTFINALLGAEVARVGVLPTTATLHRLRWGTIEVVDTPGFNSLDPRHADLAQSVLVEIDIALWLLDATQAFKESERGALEEAQRRTLPFVVVVNKSDRLSSDDLRTVMRSLDDARLGLAWSLGSLHGLCPPSARSRESSATRPRSRPPGGAPPRASSKQSIASRRDELKERALRRHALGVTLRLTAAWTARAGLEQEQARVAADWRRATARSAARLEAEEDTLAPEIARSLAPVAAVLEHDMRLVSSGRDAESAARDPALARYRADRASQRSPPFWSMPSSRLRPTCPSMASTPAFVAWYAEPSGASTRPLTSH